MYGIFCRRITRYTVMYGVYVRYFLQENHQIYGNIWCVYIYTVLPWLGRLVTERKLLSSMCNTFEH